MTNQKNQSMQASTQQNSQYGRKWGKVLSYLNLKYSCVDVTDCVSRSIDLLFEGDYSCSAEIINKVIEFHPTYGDAYVVRGLINEVVGGLYNKSRFFDDALEDYSKAVEIGTIDPAFFEERQNTIQKKLTQVPKTKNAPYPSPMFTRCPGGWYRRMNKKDIVRYINTNHKDLLKARESLPSII